MQVPSLRGNEEERPGAGGGCAKSALRGELNPGGPSVLPPAHVTDSDRDSLQDWRKRERGVVSSCLHHFLPSTPALIGNLGGPVYLHG